MSIETGPPVQPPQLSPDHKWIWDGTQWRPLAVHEAVFPTWREVGAGLPAESAVAAPRIPTPPPVARPAPVPSRAAVYAAPAAAAAAPAAEVPLWLRDQVPAGSNRYMYAAAGVIALIVLAVILNSMAALPLPWQHGTPGHAAPKPTPALAQRSDSARADRLVNQLLADPLANAAQSATLARQACAAGMTTSCEEDMITADDDATAALAVIDHETVPLCISAPALKVRADLAAIDTGSQLAVKAFSDNRPSEMQNGLGQVAAANGRLQADGGALTAAVKTCDTQPVGP